MLTAPPPPVSFGQASYVEVPAGLKTLCIDLETNVVKDCATEEILPGYTISDPALGMQLEIVLEGGTTSIGPLQVQEIKDETLIEAGTNSCYPWCYKGKYYVVCY
jgi:hypothetical protein